MDNNEKDLNEVRENLVKELKENNVNVVTSRAYEGMDLAREEKDLHTEIDTIIVLERSEDGKDKYEIYDSQKNKIATIDERGEIVYDPEFEAKFKNTPTKLEQNARELLKKNIKKEVKQEKQEKKPENDKAEEVEVEKTRDGETPQDLEDKDEDKEEEKERKPEPVNYKELGENISEDLGEEAIVSNVIDANTKVGDTETLESKLGVPGKYDKFAIIMVNGQFEVVGSNKETGKYEKVDNLERVDNASYKMRIASGEGEYENVITRDMFIVKGQGDKKTGLAINQDTGTSDTFVSSVNLDEESKTAYGIRLNGAPDTRDYVKSAVENERDGLKSATEMAKREQNLKDETGKESDNILDLTHDGEISNSVDNFKKIKLSDGSYTTIADEASKLGYNVDNYRKRLEEKTTDSVANAIEEIREDERGFSPEPEEREIYYPGNEENN